MIRTAPHTRFRFRRAIVGPSVRQARPSRPGDWPLEWVDSHIVGPSLLEFRFYGLAAVISLQFYEGSVTLNWSRRWRALPTPDRFGAFRFSRVGPDIQSGEV